MPVVTIKLITIVPLSVAVSTSFRAPVFPGAFHGFKIATIWYRTKDTYDLYS